MLPLNLYARVRFWCAQLHARPRVQRHPVFPAPSVFEGANEHANLGRNAPRGREVTFVVAWVERSDTHRHALRR